MTSVVLHRLVVMPARVLLGVPALATAAFVAVGWQIKHPHARKVHR